MVLRMWRTEDWTPTGGPRDTLQLGGGRTLIINEAASDPDYTGTVLSVTGGTLRADVPLVPSTIGTNFNDAYAASLPGGGGLLAFSETLSNSRGKQIKLSVIGQNGNREQTIAIARDTIDDSQKYQTPVVEVSNAQNALVAYVNYSGSGAIDDTLVYRFYNPKTGALSAEAELFSERDPLSSYHNGFVGYPDADVLSNGSYVVTAQARFETGKSSTSGDYIWYDVIAPDGSQAGDKHLAFEAGVGSTKRPSVTALKGGGFVIAYEHDNGSFNEAYIRLFDNDGVQQGGQKLVWRSGISSASNHSDWGGYPEVVALKSGGFMVFYQKAVGYGNSFPDLTNVSYNTEIYRLMAQRFNKSGDPVGDAVELDIGKNGLQADAELLEDGRIVVHWNESQILDPRYSVNDPAYGRAEIQVGTPVKDVFTVSGKTAYGHGGNDTITGQAGRQVIDGGAGNDKLDGKNGNDLLLGGGGNDVVLGGGGNDVLKGGAGDDTLKGHAGKDRLYGDGGRDRLEGGSGEDVLRGGASNDVLVGGGSGDRLEGGSGNDTLYGQVGRDILIGGGGSDYFAFAKGYGLDRVKDFKGQDEIALHRSSLKLSGMSDQEIVDSFAKKVKGGVLFNFGDGDKLFVAGQNLASIADDIFLF